MKRWKRVPFDSDAPDAGALIRIFRKKGRVVATVTGYTWFEPDGHEYTGYADVVTSGARPVAEVLLDYKRSFAVVALESDDLWDAAWGALA